MDPDLAYAAAAHALGMPVDGEIQRGGDYLPVVIDGGTAYVSGQVPRIGSTVVVTGRVGAAVTLAQAQHGARIGALRALALLRQSLGSLTAVRQVLRVTVYVQSAADFTRQSEVADAASALLHEVLGPAGRHTRTSVGVHQLPKDASVEVDLIAAVQPRPAAGA